MSTTRRRKKTRVTRKAMQVALALSLMALVGLTQGVVLGDHPPTQHEIGDCVNVGLAWLANQQHPDGSWNGEYPVSNTGLAVFTFENHAVFMGLSPLDPSYVYSDVVEAGLNYILRNCHIIGITPQPAGDPDANGNGIGVKASSPGNSSHEMYEVGIALMAISASQDRDRTVSDAGSPVNGHHYGNIAQDMVDFIAWGQTEDDVPCQRGGWRYAANYGWSDNSVSGYIALGLGYASSGPPDGFGLSIPNFVYSEMEFFIGNIQDPVNGDANDGGSWYVPCWDDRVNILKTGNMLSEMALLGYPFTNPDAVAAGLDYIERHWDDGNSSPGWKGDWNGTTGTPNYQACFTTMKGFQALGIETIDVVRDAVIETVDWYDQMANAILHSQNGDGSWPDSNYGDIWLNTCWALLTIDAAAPPALALSPVFDTNPLNTSHTVTALYDIAGEPQPDAQIKFEIVSGPNAGETGSDATDSNGEAGFTYDGLDIGTDTIVASVDIDGDGVADLFSNPVTKAWISPGDRISGVSIWSTLLGAAALITVAVVFMRRKLVCDL